MRDQAPTHLRLAEIGLRAGGRNGFALAGGHAIAAHGILHRPSEDVDLFADWQRRADFPAAVDEVIAAYGAAGYEVEVDHRTETFARLYLTDPAIPGEHHRVELVANWRLQPPVEMDIGPVLHPDDVMAGKVDALYNWAAARDFLDIDAAITGGRYTLEQLCQLAEAVDAGFDRSMFEQMLRYIQRFDDEDFAEYGIGSDECRDSTRTCRRLAKPTGGRRRCRAIIGPLAPRPGGVTPGRSRPPLSTTVALRTSVRPGRRWRRFRSAIRPWPAFSTAF